MAPDRRPPDGKWARARITRPTFGAMASSIGAVVVPVAIAMALCVWLVTLLRGDDAEDAAATSGGVISAMYTEKVRRFKARVGERTIERRAEREKAETETDRREPREGVERRARENATSSTMILTRGMRFYEYTERR